MKLLFLLLHSLFLRIYCNESNNVEMESGFDGEILPELSVNVVNGYDFPVEVYYDDGNGGILLVSLLEDNYFISIAI